MRRILFRLIGIAFFTWLEFAFFPGHTYLQGDTQLTVPMLERLKDPGFLSRDIVATHPRFEYTIYDEATLFLNEAAGLSVEKALLYQQVACRAAGLLGILLLALSAGLSESLALLVAASISLGGTLTGPKLMLVELEAIPRALAWGFILLAIGLVAREKPLLAGLAGGLALVYEPAIAAPFWVLLILMMLFNRRLRRMLRPTITILGIFVLLLANLAQLQPGIPEQQSLLSRISDAYAALQQYRTPYEWVSLWTGGQILSYLAIWICGIWATARIWPSFNRQSRWMLVALPACGVLSLPLSYFLLDRLRWSFIAQLQPTRWLLFTVCLTSVVCGMAGVRAARSKRIGESALWFFIVFALPLHAELLELLRVTRLADLEQLIVAVALGGALAFILVRTIHSISRVLALTVPALLVLLLRLPAFGMPRATENATVNELAVWVKRNTWGSSMFLFPDIGRSLIPGIFRARSERPVWVDWESGALVPYFQSFAGTWWDRWQQTMQPGYSQQHLHADLALPIDYYVLTRPHSLAWVHPVFANHDFVVYDANDLRNMPDRLWNIGEANR